MFTAESADGRGVSYAEKHYHLPMFLLRAPQLAVFPEGGSEVKIIARNLARVASWALTSRSPMFFDISILPEARQHH
jgi:hypothetical protein